jgi:transposase-like protein
MQQRIIRRYSLAFQRQVVEDLERGRFASIEEARRHHEIPGKTTVSQWLRRHGKNHLLAKVVRVEKPDEADRILRLRREVEQLQRALGQTQAEKLLNEELLKLACEQLGQDVEAFRKKCVGRPCTKPRATAG